MERPDNDPLATLVRRAQAGDRDAYDRLFAAAAERLHLFVRLRLGARLRERDDSLDVLQEAYLAAHQAFPRFGWQGEAAFVHWLCRIAERRLQLLAEHNGAAKRLPPAGLATVPADAAAAPHSGVVTAAARSERRAQLELALLALEPDAREAVLLRFFEGQELAAIAARLGRSASAVRRLLGGALRRLGRQLRALDSREEER